MKVKLNYNEPKDAIKIINHLVSDDSFKMSISNCRTFDACLQTLRKSTDELETIKKETKSKQNNKKTKDKCPSQKA